MIDKYGRTHEYIKNSWERAVVKPNETEMPELYVAPFVPPCLNGKFKTLFYWDTFFTNRGMIADGFTEFAKNNVDNLLFSLDRFGFVPNALSASGTSWCSQPPYLHFMIRDIYEKIPDDEWLKNAYFALKKEYHFWMTERLTEIGLNRYFHLPTTEQRLIGYYDYVSKRRLNIPTDLTDREKTFFAEHYIAAAESGHDFSPRFCNFGADIIPVDLNANLYGLEKDLLDYSRRFEPKETEYFKKAIDKRKKLMDRYCLDNDGLYYDYHILKGEKQNACCSGQFMPFITGMSSDQAASKKLLSRLEMAHGIVPTEEYRDKDGIVYQWAYPNTWAPDNHLCVWALTKMGLFADAERVAEKYLENVADTFEKTGKLWEKYDGVVGGVSRIAEYETTEMLGWTGGVFSCFYEK